MRPEPGVRPGCWRLFPKYALLDHGIGGGHADPAQISLTARNQENLAALQAEKAQGAANRIEQYVLEIQQQLSWTALPPTNATADSLEARRIEYLKLLRQVPAITDVTWLDPQGKQQLRVSRVAMNDVGAGTDQFPECQLPAGESGQDALRGSLFPARLRALHDDLAAGR